MPRTYSYRDRWPVLAPMITKVRVASGREKEIEGYANFAIQNKDKYIYVEKRTKVPWPLISVIHLRESERTPVDKNPTNFNTYLGNGQRLDRVTTIVPEGRGPFCQSLPATLDQFCAGGIDAFSIDGLSAVQQASDEWILGQKWGSWPIEKMLFYAEKLNGLGYFYKGIPSPYIWGATTEQVRGKYVRDGVFDASVWDTQPGCAAVLWMIGHLDPSVHYTRES